MNLGAIGLYLNKNKEAHYKKNQGGKKCSKGNRKFDFM